MSARRFLCSGFEAEVRRELVRKIKELGGHIVSIENLEPNEDFILICAKLKWTEKFLTACSQGMWILLPEYVEDSHKAGSWLDETHYEWSFYKQHRLNGSADRLHLINISRGWRCRVKVSGLRAFHSWRVILLIENLTLRKILSRMLMRGGASVFRRRECRDKSICKSLTHIFFNEEFTLRHEKLVVDLQSRGYPCVDVKFIVDFISQLGRLRRPENEEVTWLPPQTEENNGVSFSQDHKLGFKEDAQQLPPDVHELKNRTMNSIHLPPMSCQQKEQLTNERAVVVLSRMSFSGRTTEMLHQGIKCQGRDSVNSVVEKKLKTEITLNAPLEPQVCINFGTVVLERIGSKELTDENQLQVKRKSTDDTDLASDVKKTKMQDTLPPSALPKIRLPSGISDEVVKTNERILARPVLYQPQYAENQSQLKENRVSKFYEVNDGSNRVTVKQMFVRRKQKLKNNLGTYSKHLRALADNNHLKPEDKTKIIDPSHRAVDRTLKNNVRNLFSVMCGDISFSEDRSDFAADLKSDEILSNTPVKKVRSENIEIGDSCLRHKESSESTLERISLGDENKFGLVSCQSVLFDVKRLRSVFRPPERIKVHDSGSNPDLSSNVEGKKTVIESTTASPPTDEASLTVQPKARPWPSAVVHLVEACLNGRMQSSEGSHFTEDIFLHAVSDFCTPFSYVPPSVLSILLKKLFEERKIKVESSASLYVLVERILLFPTPAAANIFPAYLMTIAQLYGFQQPNWELLENLFVTMFRCDKDSDSLNANVLMLRFVVRFLEMDFQQSRKKILSSGVIRGQSVRWCILGRWLWTNEFASVRSTNFVRLISILVEAICDRKFSAELQLVEMIQKLVEMAAGCWAALFRYSAVDPSIPRDLWMMAVLVAEELAGVRVKRCDVKLFVETCKVNWLALSVCKILLDRMNPELQFSSNAAISLRIIVSYFQMRPFEETKVPDSPKIKRSIMTPKKSPAAIFKRRKLKVSGQQVLKIKDVNKQDSKGESLLHSACRRNNLRTVRELLEHPAIDVNLRDNAGWTPLHEACLHGNVEIVKELLCFKPKRTINSFFETLKKPSELHCVDLCAASLAEGVTPLHDAVSNDHFDICQLLLLHGGRNLLNVVDKLGRRPYDCAKSDEMRLLLNGNDACHSCQKETESTLHSRVDLLPSDSGQTVNAAADRSVSEDLSERYFFLTSNLLFLYLRCKGNQCTEDDRTILQAMAEHLGSFQKHVEQLQRGKLLSDQMSALVKLEALVQFYCSS